jgi:hypothetical protein
MLLEEFFQTFGLSWQEIQEDLWPETKRERLEARVARLERLLRRRTVALILCRRRLEARGKAGKAGAGEERYQALLARTRQTRERLGRLRERLRTDCAV